MRHRSNDSETPRAASLPLGRVLAAAMIAAALLQSPSALAIDPRGRATRAAKPDIRVLTLIMAGGEGSRLGSLTKDRAKPAVLFAGNHRIADFPLSNALNLAAQKGIDQRGIYLLTQYKSQSLIDHMMLRYSSYRNAAGGLMVHVAPAQQRNGPDWYKGTADAVHQSENLITRTKPDVVLVLAGDHINQWNPADMIRYHKAKKASVTVAGLRVPIGEASHFGVMEVNRHMTLTAFEEKPQRKPQPMPGHEDLVLASMGIYAFEPAALVEALRRDAGLPDSEHDFGKDVLPQMIAAGAQGGPSKSAARPRVRVFDYASSRLEGIGGDWYDAGRPETFLKASQDLARPAETPPIDLASKSWPMHPLDGRKPEYLGEGADRSLVFDQKSIKGAVHASVLSPGVTVEKGATVSNSVLMPGVKVGAGAAINRVIADRRVFIPENAQIGLDLQRDRERFGTDPKKNAYVSDSGVVVLGKDFKVEELPSDD